MWSGGKAILTRYAGAPLPKEPLKFIKQTNWETAAAALPVWEKTKYTAAVLPVRGNEIRSSGIASPKTTNPQDRLCRFEERFSGGELVPPDENFIPYRFCGRGYATAKSAINRPKS